MTAPTVLPWTVWATSLTSYRPTFHRTDEIKNKPVSDHDAAVLGISPTEGQKVSGWSTNCGVVIHAYLEEPPFDPRGWGRFVRQVDRGTSIASRHAVQITAARWCRKCWPEATR